MRLTGCVVVGALAAFLEQQFNPFHLYVGVSGGAIAASYCVVDEPEQCFNAIHFLSANKRIDCLLTKRLTILTSFDNLEPV